MKNSGSGIKLARPESGGLELKTIVKQETLKWGLRNLATASPTSGTVEIFPANNANLSRMPAARLRRSSGLALLSVGSHALPPSVSSIVRCP